jgi:uncharacterized phage protein (TIGR02220 family)
MYLKLPFAITDRPWFPKDKPFSEFEARIDYLMLKGSGKEPTPLDLAERWKWTLEAVSDLLHFLQVSDFLNQDWFIEEENPSKVKALINEVVSVYNEIFDRKVQLNPARERTIRARIKEGSKLKPKVGIDQFRAVFEFKKKDWKGTEQEKYLTLETLCAAKHFFGYLDAAREDYKKTKGKKKEETDGITIEGRLFK